MKTDIAVEISRALKLYIDKEISGIKLSQSLSQSVKLADGLDNKQKISFKYYIDFFEKEGKELYLASNRYLREEVEELAEFLTGLTPS